MRTAIGVQRALDNDRHLREGTAPERLDLTCRDVVEFATIEGARACGLGDRTGSLTPGKQADVIVLAPSPATAPLNNPLGAVVYAAHPGLVDTVYVAGRCRKRAGRLLDADMNDIDLDDLLRQAARSRDHLVSAFPEAGSEREWFPGQVRPDR
jgi:5-methylthioadenosine/S-adenosylhomocysteine deaminase